MQKLSIFSSTVSTTCSIPSILNREHLKEFSIRAGALRRERKFSLADYILTALVKMCNATEESEFTLKSIHEAYLKYCKDEGLPELTHKCIHKRLQSGRTFEAVNLMLSELMKASFGKRLMKKVKKVLNDDFNTLLDTLKIQDIILIDGTEIDLSYSCADNFDCKGKGRPCSDGSAPRPGLKLHVAFSFLKQSFEYIEITQAVGSERESVLTDRFHNCLLICDRGYVDEKLEQEIESSGNLYLIRGKLNTAATINTAFSDDGQTMPEVVGTTVRKLPTPTCADLDVTFSSGHKNRIIVRHNPNAKHGNKRSILRTNIPRNRLGAKQLYMLYRLRWAIELFNKANKRSNCLKSINSANENIILIFIMLSLAVSIVKAYTGLKCIVANKLSWLSLLKLHKHNDCFVKLFSAFLKRKLSTVYQVFKELLDDIALLCQRTKPSNRDAILLKDLPTLLWQIVHQPNTTANVA